VGGMGFVFDEQHPHHRQPTPFRVHARFMIGALHWGGPSSGYWVI
jgi:hypothetical protein